MWYRGIRIDIEIGKVAEQAERRDFTFFKQFLGSIGKPYVACYSSGNALTLAFLCFFVQASGIKMPWRYALVEMGPRRVPDIAPKHRRTPARAPRPVAGPRGCLAVAFRYIRPGKTASGPLFSTETEAKGAISEINRHVAHRSRATGDGPSARVSRPNKGATRGLPGPLPLDTRAFAIGQARATGGLVWGPRGQHEGL